MTKHMTPSAATDAQPEQPLLPARPAITRLRLDSLTVDPAFTARIGIAIGHVLDLARALRNCGDLDPITVWLDPATGKWVVLDGRHRIETYRSNKAATIPAVIFQGSRMEARLEAARCNSKTTFPWTTAECTQYAWGLVIEGGASKRQIVQAATVSTGTVTNMRKRLVEMTAAGEEPVGNWCHPAKGCPRHHHQTPRGIWVGHCHNQHQDGDDRSLRGAGESGSHHRRTHHGLLRPEPHPLCDE